MNRPLLWTLGLLAIVAVTVALALPASAALKPGAKAPNFKATAFLAGEAFTYQLSDALKKGPVVVYFFPAAFTAGCNIEAHMFSEAIDQFKAKGVSVIGVTAGNTDRLAEFSKSAEHCAGKFPVASDPGAKVAKQYDATLSLRPGWSNRTSYLIGKDGRIKATHSDMSPKQHVAEMLKAIP